ncbi:phosphoribosyl-AMP cyclohydrolase [Xanthobacter tagetidis]|uniref:Phosphoribosyl-AMP cyclohydrolase n=1 Tax=Xanthobacter tagetidis TaxID=60216 RepID=A0A3L7A904_9HYPH|nr:phosphoribosyl-AMP cyclohydrolase [Xanthobacter tagetidis]MBB6309360.1 phosphoribosyl-AMP cyclohydrolase [Xanthobacter tagetidis]RLP76667.1 phosphoribosyl-AMP cyclohydrolase [Xanthobacter tagetidis]
MSADTSPFAPPARGAALEEGTVLSPRFDAAGLVTCVCVDASTGEVLMLAHMNAQALALTIETGEAHYFSRSRGRLWKKGETSGHVQAVKEMRIDCDQDAVVIKVEVGGTGASCHTGRRSCFYRTVPLGAAPSPETRLAFTDDAPRFDPQAVYGQGGHGHGDGHGH